MINLNKENANIEDNAILLKQNRLPDMSDKPPDDVSFLQVI
jgi:hypothetical protein